MSEQTVIERSKDLQSCKLAYDCIMSSTKSFVYNFSLLTNEEKTEFKSLANYVKQLDKCMEVVRAQSKLVSQTTKRVVKVVEVVEVVKVAEAVKPVLEPVLEQVVEVKAVEPVSLTKSSKKTKSVEPKQETSPTAEVVAETTSIKSKRGKKVSESSAGPVQVSEPVAVVPEPVVSESVESKKVTKKSASVKK
jgi:hypothetical protein